MRKLLPILLAAAVASVLVPGPVSAQDDAAKKNEAKGDGKQESGTDLGALEVRAQQAFLAGDWFTALPLFKKVAAGIKNDADRLGAIEEQIRVCEKNIARMAKSGLQGGQKGVPPGGQPAASAQTPAANPLPITNDPPTSAEERRPHAAPKPGQVTDLTIKELGNFDYDQEKGGNIPADVKRLNGGTIRVRGFMIPMDQADNITKFALVPDLFACCFGQPPQIQHVIIANCPEGKAVGYSPDEIVVEGKLNVEEKKDDGYIVSIFEVSVTSVKAAPR